MDEPDESILPRLVAELVMCYFKFAFVAIKMIYKNIINIYKFCASFISKC